MCPGFWWSSAGIIQEGLAWHLGFTNSPREWRLWCFHQLLQFCVVWTHSESMWLLTEWVDIIWGSDVDAEVLEKGPLEESLPPSLEDKWRSQTRHPYRSVWTLSYHIPGIWDGQVELRAHKNGLICKKKKKNWWEVNQPSSWQLEAEPRAPETSGGLNLLLGQGSKAMGSFSEPVSLMCRTTKQRDI